MGTGTDTMMRRGKMIGNGTGKGSVMRMGIVMGTGTSADGLGYEDEYY